MPPEGPRGILLLRWGVFRLDGADLERFRGAAQYGNDRLDEPGVSFSRRFPWARISPRDRQAPRKSISPSRWIPAQVGEWIPACAGMTNGKRGPRPTACHCRGACPRRLESGAGMTTRTMPIPQRARPPIGALGGHSRGSMSSKASIGGGNPEKHVPECT